jgi:hypothetical protein
MNQAEFVLMYANIIEGAREGTLDERADLVEHSCIVFHMHLLEVKVISLA